MGQGNPYARIINMMQSEGAKQNAPEMALGQVVAVEPLAVAINGQVIQDHLYCNAVTCLQKDEELEAIMAGEEHISEALKAFLTEVYQGLRVQPGDLVVVQRVGNSFYVCAKVAAVEG